MKSKYVKFPSISVCLDLDTDGEGEVGFREMRPLNETFSFLHFVRHLDNGYCIGQIIYVGHLMHGDPSCQL